MKKIFILTLFMFQALFAEDIYATFDVVSEKNLSLDFLYQELLQH